MYAVVAEAPPSEPRNKHFLTCRAARARVRYRRRAGIGGLGGEGALRREPRVSRVRRRTLLRGLAGIGATATGLTLLCSCSPMMLSPSPAPKVRRIAILSPASRDGFAANEA